MEEPFQLEQKEEEEKLIDNHSIDELEKLKDDIEKLNKFYEDQNLNQSKYGGAEIKEIKQNQIKENKENKDKYDSKKYNQPILKPENFQNFLIKEFKTKELIKLKLTSLSFKKLKDIIVMSGTYPGNSRKIIWNYFLSLPNNKTLFILYSSKGLHPLYKNIDDIYPIADQKYLRRVQVICSLLTHWCPHVGDVYYLPNIVFPFIKSIEGDDLFIFETLIALLNSVFKYWLEYYPNMPLLHINYLVEIINKETDNQINSLFKELNASFNDIIWRLLNNFFSESFAKTDWLGFVDFIITYNHKPEMILYFTSAFIIHYKVKLLKNKSNVKKLNSLLFDFREKRNLSLIFKETLKLYSKYYKTQSYIYQSHTPFSDEKYPILDKFPLDFLRVTSKIKDDLINGRLDIDEEMEFSRNKRIILMQKLKELNEREKQIEFCYQDMLQLERDKNTLLKKDLEAILVKKNLVFRELNKK